MKLEADSDLFISAMKGYIEDCVLGHIINNNIYKVSRPRDMLPSAKMITFNYYNMKVLTNTLVVTVQSRINKATTEYHSRYNDKTVIFVLCNIDGEYFAFDSTASLIKPSRRDKDNLIDVSGDVMSVIKHRIMKSYFMNNSIQCEEISLQYVKRMRIKKRNIHDRTASFIYDLIYLRPNIRYMLDDSVAFHYTLKELLSKSYRDNHLVGYKTTMEYLNKKIN